jgi:hypothetical protein
MAEDFSYLDCTISRVDSSTKRDIGEDLSAVYRYSKKDGFKAWKMGAMWDAKFCKSDDDELICDRIYDEKDYSDNKMLTRQLMKLNRFTLDYHYYFEIDKPDIPDFKKTFNVDKGTCKKIDKREF